MTKRFKKNQSMIKTYWVPTARKWAEEMNKNEYGDRIVEKYIALQIIQDARQAGKYK